MKFSNLLSPDLSLPGPEDIARAVLPNGLIILARANFNSPSVVVNGYLLVGSLLDPDEKLGLADFTASALMRGTEARNFQEIYDTLESVGASLGFFGGTHSSGFSGRALAEDLPMLLNLLAETLRQPAFPGEQVERLRAQLLTGLAIRSQDTSEMASLELDQILYMDHPYRRPEDGYPDTIQAIQGADLVRFHQASYGPRGTVVVVVGSIDPSLAIEKVSAALGDWENHAQADIPELPAVNPLQEAVRRHVAIPGKSQSDVFLGIVGPARSAPDFLAASLGNSILGQFGMYGRIGEVVREQAGLAYYAYSSLSGGIGPGPWYASAGVDPENVERVITLIQEEFKHFTKEPVSPGELEDNQANYIGRLPLSLESNGGVAGAILNLERYNLGLDYYRRYPGLITSITVEDVLEASRHYLNSEKMGIATAGP